jgi:hypothetical protein
MDRRCHVRAGIRINLDKDESSANSWRLSVEKTSGCYAAHEVFPVFHRFESFQDDVGLPEPKPCSPPARSV